MIYFTNHKSALSDTHFTRLANMEKQKRHLACMMAYGKDMPETPHGPKILHKKRREPQILENVDFVNDCKLSDRPEVLKRFRNFII